MDYSTSAQMSEQDVSPGDANLSICNGEETLGQSQNMLAD